MLLAPVAPSVTPRDARSRLRRPPLRSSEFVRSACLDSIAYPSDGQDHSAYIPDHGDYPVTARTLQGVARVRSGQALAWPLSSGRSARRGSGVKRRLRVYVHPSFSPVLVALRSQSRLRLEGRARTLTGPPPDLSPARTLAPSPLTSPRTGWHPHGPRWPPLTIPRNRPWPATLTAAGITNAAAAAGVSGRYLCRRDRCRNYCCAATADTACLMRSAAAAGCDT